MATLPSPKPPDRLPDDPDRAIDELLRYQWTFFKDYRDTQQLPRRMEAIADLTPLAMTVSNPPTQAEVQALADRLDAIVAAARRVTT